MIECLWCNGFHANSRCPRVKAFEYGEDGSVRRVEFWEPKTMEWPDVLCKNCQAWSKGNYLRNWVVTTDGWLCPDCMENVKDES